MSSVEPTLRLITADTWSGGGSNLQSNASLALDLHPEAASPTGSPIVMRNRVPNALLRHGGFVYVPQNAWPWQGPAVGLHESSRRLSLRLVSEVALRRTVGTIRIGPSIPSTSTSHPSILPNELDAAFEPALEASQHLSPSWLPSRPFAVAPGSLWSYRNIAALLRAHENYLAQGGDLDLLIIGPPGRGAVPDQLRSAAVNNPAIHAVPHAVERSEILCSIAHSQMCLLPSLVEASPVTLLECAALERPIVCWDTAAYRFLAERALDDQPRFVGDDAELTEALAYRTGPTSQSLSSLDVRTERRHRWCDDFVRLASELITMNGSAS